MNKPTMPASVVSRKRVSVEMEGTHSVYTFTDGTIGRIQRMDSGSTMGLAGWHDIDNRTVGGSYLADTESEAIKELAHRRGF